MKTSWSRKIIVTVIGTSLILGAAGCFSGSAPTPTSRLEPVPAEKEATAVPASLALVDLSSISKAELSGANVDLGKGLAFAGASLFPVSPGMVLVDGIAFRLAGKGVEVAPSMAGLRERIHVRSQYFNPRGLTNMGRCVVPIAGDQYAALHVLAFSRQLPHSVPRMTVRVGTFAGYSGIFADAKVEVPDIRRGGEGKYVVSRVPVSLKSGKGAVFHLRIPLDRTGNLWWTYRKGQRRGGGLWLEFCRDVQTYVNLPDPNQFAEIPAGHPSSVVVLAATLEKSPIEMSYSTAEAGNVFYETQQSRTDRPEFVVKLTNRSEVAVHGKLTAQCAGPGTEEVANRPGVEQEWTVAARYTLTPGETKELRLNVMPPHKKRGWYKCVVSATANGRPVQTRETSFAILAPDTRRAFDDSPFGTWAFWIPHSVFANRTKQIDDLASLIHKGGWRWTYGGQPNFQFSRRGSDEACLQMAKYLQSKYSIRHTIQSPPHAYQRGAGWFDETAFEAEVVPFLRKIRERNYDPAVKVLHEARSSNKLLRRVSVFLGGEPYDMPEAEKAQIDKQFANVVKYCRAIKKADPTMKVVLINDYPGVAIEYMKRGVPKDCFDVFGLECANFMREPERQPDWLCLLGHGAIMRRAMKKYHYEDKKLWTTEALYHSTNPGNLSLHKQGVIYVREAMLAFASGFEKMAAAGTVKDSSDDYRHSNWGCAGFCFREPEINPKPSYVMMAWLTQILDQAKYAGYIASDSRSLHILDFKNQKGEHIYPVWVVRGRQKVELQTKGGRPTVFDVFGNKLPVPVRDGKLEVLATDTPVYVTGARVTAVASRTPLEIKRAIGKRLLDFGDPRQLRVVSEPSKILESNWDFPRLKGTFKNDYVQEDGATALRLELLPDADNRKLHQRYIELALAKPLELKGRPYAFNLRVKGNGGWGRVMFEMVDAKGRIWTSCGNKYEGACNASDCKGDSYISFDGWHTLWLPIVGQYPGFDQFVAWPRNADWWPENTPELVQLKKQFEDAKAAYPGKLKAYEEALRKYEDAKKAYAEAQKLPKKERPKVGRPGRLPRKPRPPSFRNYGVSPVDYPVKLTKLIVAMSPNMLYINGEVPVKRPVIYIDQLGVSQPLPGK